MLLFISPRQVLWSEKRPPCDLEPTEWLVLTVAHLTKKSIGDRTRRPPAADAAHGAIPAKCALQANFTRRKAPPPLPACLKPWLLEPPAEMVLNPPASSTKRNHGLGGGKRPVKTVLCGRIWTA